MTPGVSILVFSVSLIFHFFSYVGYIQGLEIIRLAFEIFHNIKKTVVNIWLVCKLNLDLIKVT